MKKLLLILALALSANAWAEEDNFPMKFTCEAGSNIIYVYVAEDIYKSWFQFHPLSTSPSFDKFGTEKLLVRCGSKRMRKKGSCSVDKNSIKLQRSHFKPRYAIFLTLNRTTLGSNWGQCFKGFKEYK